MKKEKIMEELSEIVLGLEDVFYSDFLQQDDISVMYELDVQFPDVLLEELESTGVTREQIENAIEDNTLQNFVQDWLNGNIDFNKIASDYGLVGSQTMNIF